MEKQAKVPPPKRPLTREEVAALLGIKERTVCNVEHRALAKLRAAFRRIA